MKKRVLAAVTVLLVTGVVFLIKGKNDVQPERRLKPSVSEIRQKIAPDLNSTTEVSEEKTAEIRKSLETLETEITEIASGSKEVHLDDIVWARPYLMKYRGKMPDSVLALLNLLLSAQDEGNGLKVQMLLQELLKNIDSVGDVMGELADDQRNSEFLRMASLEMLGRSSDPKAAEVFVRTLENENIADKLKNFALQTFAMGNFDLSVKKDVIQKTAMDKKNSNRNLALTLLRGEKSEETRNLLLEVLRDTTESQSNKFGAVYAISGVKSGTEEAVSELLKVLYDKNTEDPVGCAAVKSLSCLDPVKSLEIAEEILSDGKREKWTGSATRDAAAIITQKNKNERIVELLMERLFDKNEYPHVRDCCAGSLGRYRNEDVFQKILNEFPEQDSSGVGIITEFYFVPYNDKRAVAVIEKWLKDHPFDKTGVSKSLLQGIKLLELEAGVWTWN